MTLGRTSAGKIKIKTDGAAGLRAVECACCVTGPCSGCPDLKDLMPAIGDPPQKPTSFNWEVTLSGASWIIGNDDGQITTPSIGGVVDLTQLNWQGQLAYGCAFTRIEVTDLPEQDQGIYGIFTYLGIGVTKPTNSGCSFGISLDTWQEDHVLCSPPLRGNGGVTVSPDDFFGTHSLNYTVNYYLCDESSAVWDEYGNFLVPPTETLYRSWQVGATVTIS